MGGSTSGDTSTVIQYAPYVNDAHGVMINIGWDYMVGREGSASPSERGVTYSDDALVKQSPYGNYDLIDPDLIIWGSGGFGGTQYDHPPSLWDYFYYFLGGDQLGENDIAVAHAVNNPTLEASIVAEDAYLQTDLDTNVLPKLRAHLADIGAVMTSSFQDSTVMAQDHKQKVIAKYSADLKMRAFEIGQGMWSKILEMQQQNLSQYVNLVKMYYMARIDWIHTKLEMDSKNILWPFTVIDHMRGIVSCLQNSHAGMVAGDNNTAQLIGGALAATSIGSRVAGWIGPSGSPSPGPTGGYAFPEGGDPIMNQISWQNPAGAAGQATGVTQSPIDSLMEI